ncbi:MAG: GHMP kinase [Blastocatellia bacterium]|nr:GHMP kinase [Blastocatellia bacterium]
MIIEAKAPTRIDLAGGTVDMWPLYLFHPGAQTINVAIDLLATCRIEERLDDRIIIESEDLELKEEYASQGEMNFHSPLQLVTRMIDFFKPYTGLKITTRCAAPPGSGLGGSSALAIALAGGLDSLTGNRYAETQLLRIAQNVETQVIRVPSGVQDYYPAMFGGCNSIHLEIQGVVREALSIDLAELQDQTVLCYTGKPHFSGTNNWQIFKSHIDDQDGIHDRFSQLVDITNRMRIAVIERNLDTVAACLAEEWAVRKQFAEHVTTDKIEQLIATASTHGALAAKVCGAGGGGCVVFLTEPGHKQAVSLALAEAGGDVLAASLTDRGLRIEQVG